MPGYLVLAILFSVFTSLLSAQYDFHFADSTAQWNYLNVSSVPQSYGGDSTDHFYSTDVWAASGDTTIGPQAYQKVKIKNYSGFYVNVCVRCDSATNVYLYNNSGDELLYKFESQKGDTFSRPAGDWISDLRISIDSVDSVYLGKWRKRMFVTYMSATVSSDIDDFNPYWGNDVWIAGIGALVSSPFSILNTAWIGGPSCSLLCFYENNSALYHQSTYDTCNINTVSAIDEVSGQIAIKIIPNPVSNNLLHVQFTQATNQPVELRLYDVTGRTVLQKPLNAELNTIATNEISRGIYFYSISTGSNHLTSGKLIVE